MYKSKAEKRVEHMTVLTGIAAGASLIGGVALLESPHNAPAQVTPMEKSGDHHGAVHNTQPGTGIMHTEKGSFHVTQNHLPTHGMTTGAAVKRINSGPVQTIDYSQKK